MIPIHYYKTIIYNNNFNCNIFDEFKSYLEYRYGNWEVPNYDWDLFRDDGGIIKKSPAINIPLLQLTKMSNTRPLFIGVF